MSWVVKESIRFAAKGERGGGRKGRGHILSRGLDFKLRHGDGDRDVGRPTDLWRESGITTTVIIIIIVSYPVLFSLKRFQL